jgi:hypothetical protein
MTSLIELVGRSADRLLSTLVPTATAAAAGAAGNIYCYCRRDVDNYRYQWWKYCLLSGECTPSGQTFIQC